MGRNTRRHFLKATAVTGVGYWVAGGIQPKESKAANEKIQFACIGIGGKGSSDSADAGKSGDVVAICDINEGLLNSAGAERFKGAKPYFDYRILFDEMGSKIDAVTVSTPDHHHAPATALAMKLGKHAFCQKPLTHTIYEARRLGEIAREKGVMTQMGNQGTAESGLRKGAATIKSGALGTVSEVHIWTNRPVWPQGGSRPPEQPVPPNVKWEEFLGPAPERPYGPGYQPFSWRGWWDFGTGALGDMACHTANMAFMGLNMRDPSSVQATTSGHNRDSYPKWSTIVFEFPELNGRAPFKLFWYDGGKKPDQKLAEGKKYSDSGSLIIGDKGKLYSPNDYGAQYELIGCEQPQVEFEQSPGHFAEFVRAIKENKQAMSNFPDYAAPLTETILLGNLAVFAAADLNEGEGKDKVAVGKKVEWDSKALKPTNSPELEKIVRKEYRGNYSV